MKEAIFLKRFACALSMILLLGFASFNAFAASVDESADGSVIPAVNIIAKKDANGVTAVIQNPSDADASVRLICAAYEPSGKLAYSKEYLVETDARASSEPQRFDYDIASHPEYKINLFAWDSVSYAPISVPVTTARYITADGSGAVYDGVTVTGDPAVTRFMYVKADELGKTGVPYIAEKTGDDWTHTRVYDVDVIIAQRPAVFTGGALPKLATTTLRMSNGNNRMRVIISMF